MQSSSVYEIMPHKREYGFCLMFSIEVVLIKSIQRSIYFMCSMNSKFRDRSSLTITKAVIYKLYVN